MRIALLSRNEWPVGVSAPPALPPETSFFSNGPWMTAAGHSHADRKYRRLHDPRRCAGASARCRAGALDCTMGLWYWSILYIAYQVYRAHLEIPIDTGLLACTADEAARCIPSCRDLAVRDRALLVLGVKTGVRVSEGLSSCVGDGWPYGPVCGTGSGPTSVDDGHAGGCAGGLAHGHVAHRCRVTQDPLRANPMRPTG